jgi:hypothetical protein
MRKVLAVVALGTLVFGAGCASTRQFVPFPDQGKRVEDPEKGRIYVMRTASLGCAVPMKVHDGDLLIGRTGARGYLCWERPPGVANIRSKAENLSTLDITVEKGGVYYILQQVAMGMAYARNRLILKDEEKGKKLLNRCNPPTSVSE